MRKGEVWRVRLPMLPGHTQGGERPAVVVQNDSFTSSLPTVWVVPFTSKTAAARFPGTVMVQPDGQNGLTVPSVALVFQLSRRTSGPSGLIAARSYSTMNSVDDST